ncbi:hypothetical protein GGX14DRAFT_466215 [Mycena pura]|uniref:Zn(2)-C6 fungal-type domain-containing protein n=1 Tax=Mycena pura TaxID=153505 RepID=A0AAD6V247_9AGAR|nr:hypothetical protein GGX14DRAFT_466215 [Mycena pura]
MNSNSSALFEVPRRVALACANCRERKIKCITEGKDRTCMRCHFNGMQCEYVATQRQRERVLSKDASTRTRAGRKTQAQGASRSPRLSPYPSPRLQLEVPPPEPEWAMSLSYGDAAAPAFEFAAYECALSPSLSPLPSIARSGCRPSAGTPSLALASDHDVDVFALAGGAYYGAAADADAYPTPPSSASAYPHPHESQTALYGMHTPDALPSPLYGSAYPTPSTTPTPTSAFPTQGFPTSEYDHSLHLSGGYPTYHPTSTPTPSYVAYASALMAMEAPAFALPAHLDPSFNYNFYATNSLCAC